MEMEARLSDFDESFESMVETDGENAFGLAEYLTLGEQEGPASVVVDEEIEAIVRHGLVQFRLCK